MKIFAAILTMVSLTAVPGWANGDDPLAEYLWVSRPLVVFADSEDDPRFQQQMGWVDARRADLEERDVIVLTDVGTEDTALRTKLRPRGFMIVLIGKEGQGKLRKPFPWDARELTRAIDKMPLRQQELRAR